MNGLELFLSFLLIFGIAMFIIARIDSHKRNRTRRQEGK